MGKNSSFSQLHIFLQEMLINIKKCHFRSSINHLEHPFHRTFYHQLLSSYEYCKVFKNTLEHLQKQSFADVLKSFPNFTGKHLCWSLYLKSFIKKSHQHRRFHVKFANFLKTHFFTEHLRRLLLHFRWLLLYFFLKK